MVPKGVPSRCCPYFCCYFKLSPDSSFFVVDIRFAQCGLASSVCCYVSFEDEVSQRAGCVVCCLPSLSLLLMLLTPFFFVDDVDYVDDVGYRVNGGNVGYGADGGDVVDVIRCRCRCFSSGSGREIVGEN